jgi:hypothetical protein
VIVMKLLEGRRFKEIAAALKRNADRRDPEERA